MNTSPHLNLKKNQSGGITTIIPHLRYDEGITDGSHRIKFIFNIKKKRFQCNLSHISYFQLTLTLIFKEELYNKVLVIKI
jgi:hypothetical protein